MTDTLMIQWQGALGITPAALPVYCAGYAGRDQRGVRAHIEELAKLGVPAPPRTPIFYRVSPTQVTTAGNIQVLGEQTSGEVEFAVFRLGGEDYVTVASDHTDREVEKTSIPQAKQLCPKVLAPHAWPVRQVQDRWDALQLRSYISAADGSGRRLYQEGSAGSLMSLEELRGALQADTGADPLMCLLLSGTIPVVGGEMVCAARFEMELVDPATGAALRHSYTIDTF
ncbi:MAG: DUF2848 family protein [Candidatus Deferrimicrobium sp.]